MRKNLLNFRYSRTKAKKQWVGGLNISFIYVNLVVHTNILTTNYYTTVLQSDDVET